MIPHGLKHLLDVFGIKRLLGLILIVNLQGYIILPLFRRIFPQILKVIIIKIGPSIDHIKCTRDPIISWNIHFVGIALIFSSTSNGPVALIMTLDFLLEGNLSFLRCTHTRSPG